MTPELEANIETGIKLLIALAPTIGTIIVLFKSWQSARQLEKQIMLLKLQKEKDLQDKLISLQDEKDLVQARLDNCLEGRLTDSQMRRPTS